MGIRQHLGKRRHVAEPEIEPLARDGMDGMGRVADEHQALADIACRMQQPQGIGPAPAEYAEAPEGVAEAPFDLRRKGSVVEGEHGGNEIAALGPDDGGAMHALVIGHGQHGKGAGGQKMLMGDTAMSNLVGDGADDPGLGIGEFGNADPRRGTQRRARAVGCHDEAGHDPASVGELDLDRGGPGVHGRHAQGCRDGHIWQIAEARQQRPADGAVLDDRPERRIEAALPMIVVQEQGGRRMVHPAVRNADIEDGLGRGRHAPPQPERGERLLRAKGDRRSAAVIADVEALGGALRIDQHAGYAHLGQGHGGRHADHPAAGNEHFGPERRLPHDRRRSWVHPRAL